MSKINVKCNINQCEFNKSDSCTKDEIEINLMCDEYEQATCTNYKESKESIRGYYDIQKLEELPFDYIVFSKSCNSSSNYIKDIAEDCMTDKKIVNIIFDNLLSVGISSNRYMYVEYNFKINDISKIDTISIPKDHIIRKISTEYYRSNPEMIVTSILNSAQKKMILEGIAI